MKYSSPYIRYCLTALLLLLQMATVWAEEQNVNPGINQHYENTEYERWVGIFERPGREVYDKRQEIITKLGINTGMVVADIGAGTGFYSLLFARQVGHSGVVYAVDIADDFIKNILRIAAEKNLSNIKGIISSQKDTRLPTKTVDLAFVCDTYHHFEYPQTMLASIHQSLKPNGRLFIIDFRKQRGISSAWVMSHVRGDKTTVIKEVTSSGFRLIAEYELLHDNYFLEFVKPDI